MGKTEILHFSNVDDVAKARQELDKSLQVLRGLELSALTSYEITQRLKDLTTTLKKPLAEVEMHPPTLDENDQVKPPLPDGTRFIEPAAA